MAADANLGAASGGLAFGGGTLQFLSEFTTNRVVTLSAGGGTFDTNGNNATLGGTICGTGGLTKIGNGTLTLSGASTYSGATAVNAGTLQAGATNAFAPGSAFTVASGATLNLASFNQTIGSLAGAGAVTLGAATLTTGNDNTSTTFSGAISGTGGLTKTGTGTLLLTGISSYTGATTVNAGTLSVNGSIANSAVTVNAGGTIGGNGTSATPPSTAARFAPGNSIGTLTVQGNLGCQSAAAYLVEVSPTNADRTNVTGTASLAGTVQAVFAPGSYSRAPTPSSRPQAASAAPVQQLDHGQSTRRLRREPQLHHRPSDPEPHRAFCAPAAYSVMGLSANQATSPPRSTASSTTAARCHPASSACSDSPAAISPMR